MRRRGSWRVVTTLAVTTALATGTFVSKQATAAIPAPAPSPLLDGYREVASDGGIFTFLTSFQGSHGGAPLNQPIVSMASTPDGQGYWLVASDGGIFNYGDAGYFGSHGGAPLNKPIVGMAATPDGRGYWFVASDGGVFNYGDAGYFGSHGGSPLNKPIVGIAATKDGNGYWLVASDGGIFNYGDAGYDGSHGGSPLNKPIVGMSATSDGDGYWMVASDGGIFNYGDASYLGSHGGTPLNQSIVGMAASNDGGGYWLVASDGGIFNYGDAPFRGSEGGSHLNKPIVGMSRGPLTFTDGTWVVDKDIPAETFHTTGTDACYWERDSDLSGSVNSIIANDIISGPDIVTVLGSDAAFKSDTCGQWSVMYTSGPQSTSFGDGVFAVGVDIAPGTYSTAGSGSCYWARLSDFTGNLNAIIANFDGAGPQSVTISPGDDGFESQGCGVWTHQ